MTQEVATGEGAVDQAAALQSAVVLMRWSQPCEEVLRAIRAVTRSEAHLGPPPPAG